MLIHPSGKVVRVQMGRPYAGTSTGKCIGGRFAAMAISASFRARIGRSGPAQAVNDTSTHPVHPSLRSVSGRAVPLPAWDDEAAAGAPLDEDVTLRSNARTRSASSLRAG